VHCFAGATQALDDAGLCFSAQLNPSAPPPPQHPFAQQAQPFPQQQHSWRSPAQPQAPRQALAHAAAAQQQRPPRHFRHASISWGELHAATNAVRDGGGGGGSGQQQRPSIKTISAPHAAWGGSHHMQTPPYRQQASSAPAPARQPHMQLTSLSRAASLEGQMVEQALVEQHDEQAQRRRQSSPAPQLRRDAHSASPTSSGGVRYATAQFDSFALHSANSSRSNSLHSGYAAGGMRHISIPGAADAAPQSLNATIGFSNPMGCYPDALSVATLSSGTSVSPAVAPDAVPAQHLDSSQQQPWHDDYGCLLAHSSGGSAGSDGPGAAAHLPGSARGRPDSALVDAHTMIMRYDRVDPGAAFAMAQSALDTEVRLLPSEV